MKGKLKLVDQVFALCESFRVSGSLSLSLSHFSFYNRHFSCYWCVNVIIIMIIYFIGSYSIILSLTSIKDYFLGQFIISFKRCSVRSKYIPFLTFRFSLVTLKIPLSTIPVFLMHHLSFFVTLYVLFCRAHHFFPFFSVFHFLSSLASSPLSALQISFPCFFFHFFSPFILDLFPFPLLFP